MTPRPIPLAEELQQSKPFSSVSEEALVALLRTASLLRRAIARRVEPFGISSAQYNVLRILRGAGEGGMPTLGVRARLVEEAPGITRLIDKLEASGHVVRIRDGADRRTVRCRITPAGLRLLQEMEPGIQSAHDLFDEALPDERDRETLVRYLAELRVALDEVPARPKGRARVGAGRG